MYSRAPQPDMQEAARFGFTAADYVEDDVEIDVWQDNAEAFLVFVNLGTQWRAVPGCAIGLDYTAIEPVLRLMGIPADRWPALFDDLLVLEGAALKQINQNRQP